MKSSALTCTAIFALATGAFAAPKLEVHPSAEFKFGFAPQNSQLITTYWLYNAGDDTLKISKVQPGCGCTSAPLEKSAVAPGDSAKLQITFDSKSMMGMTSKRIAVSTNAERPDTNLQFLAEIVRRPDSTWPMTVLPYKLDLTQMGEKVRDRITMTLQNVGPDPISLKSISVPSELFSVKFPDQIAGNQTAKVELVLTPEAVKKEFVSSMTIEVTGKEEYRYSIPVKRKLKTLEPSTTAVASPGSGK